LCPCCLCSVAAHLIGGPPKAGRYDWRFCCSLAALWQSDRKTLLIALTAFHSRQYTPREGRHLRRRSSQTLCSCWVRHFFPPAAASITICIYNRNTAPFFRSWPSHSWQRLLSDSLNACCKVLSTSTHRNLRDLLLTSSALSFTLAHNHLRAGSWCSRQTHRELFASVDHGEAAEPRGLSVALVTLAAVTVLVAARDRSLRRISATGPHARSGSRPLFRSHYRMRSCRGSPQRRFRRFPRTQNKLDLSVGISPLGSAAQMALFVGTRVCTFQFAIRSGGRWTCVSEKPGGGRWRDAEYAAITAVPRTTAAARLVPRV